VSVTGTCALSSGTYLLAIATYGWSCIHTMWQEEAAAIRVGGILGT
jgi:hypothetical protein